MLWVDCLLPPLIRHRVVKHRIIAGECFLLVLVEAGEDGLRWALHVFLRFVLKGSPAEEAALVAAERWRHLDAAVAVDPVELVLVAHFTALEGTLAPHAGFECCG